jgi:hypothetical protein
MSLARGLAFRLAMEIAKAVQQRHAGAKAVRLPPPQEEPTERAHISVGTLLGITVMVLGPLAIFWVLFAR